MTESGEVLKGMESMETFRTLDGARSDSTEEIEVSTGSVGEQKICW